MDIMKGEIGPRSTYQKGDMFVHKKHGFLVQIVGAGRWRDVRKVKVIKGLVPLSLLKSRGLGSYGYKSLEYGPGYEMEYNITSLCASFTRLGDKAGRILFGD